MDKIETIADFYKGKFDWMPDNLKNEISHFNVFDLEPYKVCFRSIFVL